MSRLVGAPLALGATVLVLAGCASNPPPPYTPPPGTAAPSPTHQEAVPVAPLPTDRKLDVGIDVFDPGIEGLATDQHITTASVRRAEAHYIPTVLANTLERRGVWGRVRMLPKKPSEMDIWIDGRILESDLSC